MYLFEACWPKCENSRRSLLQSLRQRIEVVAGVRECVEWVGVRTTVGSWARREALGSAKIGVGSRSYSAPNNLILIREMCGPSHKVDFTVTPGLHSL
jgi:hypothetical protein